MTVQEQYDLWLSHAEGELLEELRSICGNAAELERRFGVKQTFGTAGIRCVMGAGSSLLNVYTVRRVARGLAAYVLQSGVNKSCAIGYDCRNHSREFAEVAAAALAAEGVQVYLYDRLAPTPMLSFAVRHLHCGAGMVISASHNTKEYNGLKCYGEDGCQMTELPAARVSEEMEKIDLFAPQTASFESLLAAGTVQWIGEEVWEAYYDTITRQTLRPELVKQAGLTVVYSPLCGAGGEPVTKMLKRLGAVVHTPESQRMPDGSFTACPNPNPENDESFAENYKLADAVRPDILLATDPDSDRIACAVKCGGGYRKFTGNEMGCLLLDYIFSAYRDMGTTPKKPVCVMSIVSSPMAAAIAARYGCDMRITPTGFKYIGATILELEAENRPEDFVLGFEESCGYLKGTYCRDKDAVVTAMLIAEMAAYYKLLGKSLDDAMNDLYREYGFITAALQNILFTTPEIRNRCQEKLAQFKTEPPKAVAGIPVIAATDFAAGIRLELATDREEKLDFPRENMIRLELEGQGRIILRPSGTEPKMKVYYTAVSGSSLEDARAIAEKLQFGMTTLLEL